MASVTTSSFRSFVANILGLIPVCRPSFQHTSYIRNATAPFIEKCAIFDKLTKGRSATDFTKMHSNLVEAAAMYLGKYTRQGCTVVLNLIYRMKNHFEGKNFQRGKFKLGFSERIWQL